MYPHVFISRPGSQIRRYHSRHQFTRQIKLIYTRHKLHLICPSFISSARGVFTLIQHGQVNYQTQFTYEQYCLPVRLGYVGVAKSTVTKFLELHSSLTNSRDKTGAQSSLSPSESSQLLHQQKPLSQAFDNWAWATRSRTCQTRPTFQIQTLKPIQ